MNGTKIQSLMVLADREVRAAQYLRDGEGFELEAAYMLSQAAEKAARAVSEHAGVDVGNGHNFGQIAIGLPSAHPMRSAVMALDHLSPASTRFRYPDPRGHVPRIPTLTTLDRQLSEVRAFIELVRDHLKPKPVAKDVEALARGLRSRMLSRAWEVPDDFVERIQIYADADAIEVMISGLRHASDLKDLLLRHSISFPGLTDR